MVKTVAAVMAMAFLAGAAGAAESSREQREAMKRYKAGQDAMAGERFEEALKEFEAATAIDPLLVLAHYGAGQAHMALKQYPEAVRAYTRTEEAFHQEEANAASDRAAADRRIDDYIKALEDEMRSLQRVAAGNNQQAMRAEQAAQLKEQQISSLKMRRQRDTSGPEPTPAWLSLALGSAYFRMGKLPEAEQNYSKAVTVNPNLGEAHSNLAVVYLLTGRLAEADAQVQTAEKAGFKVNPQLKKDIAARKLAN
jgi:tetratricopeptide (TPR) repeat protein